MLKKKNAKTAEEQYESVDTPSGGQYLPVHDKPTALDTIFRDPEVRHGLSLFTTA
jgi:hypothetical protein